MDSMQQIRARCEVNKYLQHVASNDNAVNQIEPSIVKGSLNDRLELAILRLAVHGAFMVLTEGSRAHFIAGGRKVNRDDTFSELVFSTDDNAWPSFFDADLSTWSWLFQRTVANDASTTPQGQVFMIPALQHRNETAKLSSVVGSPHLSFYGAVPLISKGGQPIGVLFVIDTIGRSSLSVPEAAFLVSIGVKCVEVLDRAQEQSFHNRWIVLQEQIDVFVQSTSQIAQVLEEPRSQDGTNSSPSRTNDEVLERADPDAISRETQERAAISDGEGREAKRRARAGIHHDEREARYYVAHDTRTSTSKTGDDYRRRERSEGTSETMHGKIFRKAARCLQHAVGADGVLFAGGIASLDEEVGSTTEPELELVRECTQSPWTDSDTSKINSHSNIRTLTSAEYRKGSQFGRSAEIFGISDYSNELNPSPMSSVKLSGIDDRYLERLMDRHPTGAMWCFTDTRVLRIKEGTLIEAGSPEETEKLRVTFPGAKQLMYVPLNDPTSAKRLCACFVWRNQETPVFTDTADLGCLKVFSRVLESEIGRYDTAAVAKQKATFVSSVSHELRTPLHGILGAVQLLDESGLDPLQKSLAGIITSCGSTLHETLTSVLSYAKINQFERRQNESRCQHLSSSQWALSNKQGLATDSDQNFNGLYTRTNVALLCEEVVGVAESGRSFQSSTDEAVIVVCDISYEENWSYFTESGALRRIAVNLIGNALKYTERGSVTVSLIASRPGAALTSSRTLTLRVKDTGKGMSKEFLQNHLFTPFTQEDSTSSNGVGLGMSMVKSLVALLSGEIQVQSDVRSGSEINVHLPMRMCDPRDEHESSPTFAFNQNTRTLRARRLSVVMFGFPEFVRTSLRTYLCEWYDCILLENTDEAKPDIVLVDEGDIEALEEVKKTADAYGLQAVLLSAVLVISQMGKRMDTIRGYKKWERIPRPIGPGNVGKGLMGCLPKLDELKRQGHEAVADIPDSSSKFDERTRELSSDSTKDISKGLPMWALGRLQMSQHPGTKAAKDEPSTSLDTANHDRGPVSSNRPSNTRFGKSHSEQSSEIRILLVDDNELNLKLLGVFLKRNGYHNTRKVKNGSEAVQAVRGDQDGFDVVFMDLSMPVMDGFEATRELRRLEAAQDLPATTKAMFIVALTGLASANDEKNAFDAGVDMYLTKPVQFSKLTTLLRDYTDKML